MSDHGKAKREEVRQRLREEYRSSMDNTGFRGVVPHIPAHVIRHRVEGDKLLISIGWPNTSRTKFGALIPLLTSRLTLDELDELMDSLVTAREELQKSPEARQVRLYWVQEWEESERGWGVRPDGFSAHAERKDINIFLAKMREAEAGTYRGSAPDEYSRPCGEPFQHLLSPALQNELENSKRPGIWLPHEWKRGTKP